MLDIIANVAPIITAGAFVSLVGGNTAEVLVGQIMMGAIMCAGHAIGTCVERRRARKARWSDNPLG